jgi:hypothetical protein
VLPPGTAGKKDSVWDTLPEINLKQDEIEELYENKKKEVVTNTEAGKVVNVVKKKTYFERKYYKNKQYSITTTKYSDHTE